jgi:hypothetical protein
MAPKTIPMSASRPRADRGGRRKGAGWSAKWSDELKIANDETVAIQLTPAKYLSSDSNGDVETSFFSAPMFQLQFQNKNGNTSWGYFRGQPNGPCTLQELADSNHAAVKEPRYGEPNRFFVNIIQYSVFQRVPIMREGKPMTYSTGKLKGQPVYGWNEAKSVRERRALAAAQSEDVTFYRKKFLEMSAPQFKIIQEAARKARSMCRCGGSLFPGIFVCDTCEEVLLDTSTAEMSDSEIASYGDQDLRCRHCSAVGFPRPVFDCDTCKDPNPHLFSEVVIKLKKVQGANGFPSLVLDNVLPVTEFRLENKEVLATVEDGNLVYPEDVAALMKVQYDFNEYTAPKSNAEYASMLGLRDGDIGFVTDTKRYDRFR